MGNPFVHAELHSNDIEGAKEFYGKLFDWKLESIPLGEGGYTMIGTGEGIGGGMMANPDPGAPAHWLTFVQVDNVATMTKGAQDLGAAVILEPMEVPGFGRLRVIADPSGAALGLWQTH